MSGLLKRKYEEVDEDRSYSSPSSLSSSAYSGWDSEGESCYSDTLDSTPSNPGSPASSFSSEYPLCALFVRRAPHNALPDACAAAWLAHQSPRFLFPPPLNWLGWVGRVGDCF